MGRASGCSSLRQKSTRAFHACGRPKKVAEARRNVGQCSSVGLRGREAHGVERSRMRRWRSQIRCAQTFEAAKGR